MSFIREDKGNSILIQSGYGVPTHLSTIGSFYVDKNDATPYINKDGLVNWSIIGSGGGGGGVSISGGTFNNNTLFLNNTDNTQILITGFTDYYVTGLTFNNNNLKIYRNDNVDFNVNINHFTSLTIDTLSANTYLNLNYITGGTYNDSTKTLSLITNEGNIRNITGFTDVYVTGGTYEQNQIKLFNNDNTTVTLSNSDFEDWTDISSTVNITGFTSYTIKNIQYMRNGKTLTLMFDIRGTGDGNRTIIQLPYLSSLFGNQANIIRIRNSTTQNISYCVVSASDDKLNFYTSANDGTATSWSDATNRHIQGNIIINIA